MLKIHASRGYVEVLRKQQIEGNDGKRQPPPQSPSPDPEQTLQTHAALPPWVHALGESVPGRWLRAVVRLPVGGRWESDAELVLCVCWREALHESGALGSCADRVRV